MSRLALLGGAPSRNLELLALQIAARDKVELVEFHLAAMLARVREATFHRATIWQGVDAQPVKWIDPAVRALAPLVVDGIGGAAALLLNVHIDNARRLEQLACALPEAVFLALVDDGAAAASISSPENACAWARQWVSFVEPVARLEAELGARLLVVRELELVAEPARTLARCFEHLGIAAACEWVDEQPSSGARLAGEALDAFLAHAPARHLLRHFGFPAAEPRGSLERYPVADKTLVSSLVAEGRLDEARAVIERSLSRQRSAPVLEALGVLELRAGRETEAVHAFLQAIQLDSASLDAWSELLGLHQRPETVAVAEFARFSQQLPVRAALARWLVARGLDAEAAEIVASVEHQPWRA